MGWLLVGGAVLALLGAAIYMVYDAGYDAGTAEVRAEWFDANQAQRAKETKQGNTASTKLEQGNAEARIVYRTITQEVDRIVDRPVYVNACFDDDGLRHANAALAGALTPARKPDGAVPEPDAAGRPLRGLRAPEAGGGGGSLLRVPEATPGAG
jgi:hypothetical protein